MALSVLPNAAVRRAAAGAGCNAAGQSAGDVPRPGPRSGGAPQRYPAQVSEIRIVPGTYAVHQLFHDHDLSHAGALFVLDMEPFDCHRGFCRADLAGSALWPDADPEPEVSRIIP